MPIDELHHLYPWEEEKEVEEKNLRKTSRSGASCTEWNDQRDKNGIVTKEDKEILANAYDNKELKQSMYLGNSSLLL